ncbi:unnamed protein product [Mytilus coruscus]|uniref:Uncharacterized protein n=1 Tax=Mytilus coruscus TaxID=42192 RepID=A0A6J7ZUG3_MYTCO|nr:unnamed protein product [Mytilus coruscus]
MNVKRDHNLKSTDDYRKILIVPVNLKCEKRKKFDLYCKARVACFPSQHKQCSDAVIYLNEAAAKKAKGSTALRDLEDSINGTLNNMKHFINNRNVAMENLVIEEQSVSNSISEMRVNVNNHLDELEKNMLNELSKICQISNLIHDEVQTVESITTAMQDFKTGVEMHPGIISLLGGVYNFGKVNFQENNFSLPFKDAKFVRTQIVHTPTTKSFDRTRLQLRQNFKTKGETNGLMCNLPNSHLLIVDFNGDSVIMEYSED